MNDSVLTNAFEALAQSMRMLLEANYRSQELILFDPHEASGNIEQSLSNVLNSFHSLYDACGNAKIDFDWHASGETASILAIRNARHHNISNKIRGLYEFHLQKDDPSHLERYLYVDFPETKDGGKAFDLPISWHDMHELLKNLKSELKFRSATKDLVYSYLCGDIINQYHEKYKIPKDHVFFNINPILVNTLIKIIPFIKSKIKTRSLEAETFISFDVNVLEANTRIHVLHELPIFFLGLKN